MGTSSAVSPRPSHQPPGSLPARAARLIFGGHALDLDSSLHNYGIEEGATLHMVSRLRGGALTVHPRVQRERWSLYWKETMATATDLLDDVVLDDINTETATASDLLNQVASRQGWRSADELLALEGFEGPWERVLYKGRELDLAKTLAEQGVPADADLTTVRLALVAEGWKVSGLAWVMGTGQNMTINLIFRERRLSCH